MKKMVCILSALGMLLTTVPAISASAEETATLIAGDANQSGSVDILDLITVNKATLGTVKLSDAQIMAVDFNHNGIVDSEDSLVLLKYLVEITDSLPSVEQTNTLQLNTTSSVGAEMSVPELIPGFEKTVTEEHDQQTGADYMKHYITAAPEADAPVNYDTHYAPTWIPADMMLRTEVFEHATDDLTDTTITGYAKEYSQIYYVPNEPCELRFEQKTIADFNQTLIEQDPAYLETLAQKNHEEENTSVITINGTPGFYTKIDNYRNGKCTSTFYQLIWKQGGYVMQLNNYVDLSLEDMVRIAESVVPEKRVFASAVGDASNEPKYNFVQMASAEGNGITYMDITVDPAEDAPTDYSRTYRINALPENVRLESTCTTFSYTDLGQKGDIECLTTRHNVLTENGMKNVTLYVQTQKDFDFLMQYGPSINNCGIRYDCVDITVNGHPGFCYLFITSDQEDNPLISYFPCWMQDGYVMFMHDSCHFTLEEVIKIAESVSEVQKS